jgi:hypothetical protein
LTEKQPQMRRQALRALMPTTPLWRAVQMYRIV